MKHVDEAKGTALDPQALSACNGVDPTLIRWMLSLTPLERLRAMQSAASLIVRLRQRVRSSN